MLHSQHVGGIAVLGTKEDVELLMRCMVTHTILHFLKLREQIYVR